MRIRAVLLVLACAVVCAVPVAASAKHKKKSVTTYYVALGDSLARGDQPNAAGKTVNTNQGYADQLFASLKKQKKYKNLKLVELGCPGETTTTMMNGGKCKYAAGSQLQQAVKFLTKHKGKIAFLTIDIGANDVDGCASGTSINGPCVAAGEQSISTNVPKIAAALRAAGKKVTMVGMTYYDPFLADYLQSSSGKTIAAGSVPLDKQVNTNIANAYAAQQFKVADVATTFDTYTPFTTTATYKGQTVPLAVARICQWTWMCAPKPKGPNIHANKTGYKQIAKTFKGQL